MLSNADNRVVRARGDDGRFAGIEFDPGGDVVPRYPDIALSIISAVRADKEPCNKKALAMRIEPTYLEINVE